MDEDLTIDSEVEGTIGMEDRDSKGTTIATMATGVIGTPTLGATMEVGIVPIMLIGTLEHHLPSVLSVVDTTSVNVILG